MMIRIEKEYYSRFYNMVRIYWTQGRKIKFLGKAIIPITLTDNEILKAVLGE